MSSDSRSLGSNIAVILTCLLAIVSGSGCVTLKNAKSFEIDSPFVDIEYEALENKEGSE